MTRSGQLSGEYTRLPCGWDTLVPAPLTFPSVDPTNPTSFSRPRAGAELCPSPPTPNPASASEKETPPLSLLQTGPSQTAKRPPDVFRQSYRSTILQSSLLDSQMKWTQ